MRAGLVTVCALMALWGGFGPAPAAAKEQHFSAEANGQISFVMPSNNIGCIYTAKGGTSTYEPVDGGPELSCDRIQPSYVNVVLGPKGPAKLTENPGEQACCSGGNVLAYGNSVHFDGFMCNSSSAGLTCETPDKRHGFCVAKSRMLHY
ncbi:MAG: hypothetical protein ABI398_12020 [Devosia sp.]